MFCIAQPGRRHHHRGRTSHWAPRVVAVAGHEVLERDATAGWTDPLVSLPCKCSGQPHVVSLSCQTHLRMGVVNLVCTLGRWLGSIRRGGMICAGPSVGIWTFHRSAPGSWPGSTMPWW